MDGNCPKTLFFLGNSMTIKFGKLGNFAHFIVRNFVVIWEAPNFEIAAIRTRCDFSCDFYTTLVTSCTTHTHLFYFFSELSTRKLHLHLHL